MLRFLYSLHKCLVFFVVFAPMSQAAAWPCILEGEKYRKKIMFEIDGTNAFDLWVSVQESDEPAVVVPLHFVLDGSERRKGTLAVRQFRSTDVEYGKTWNINLQMWATSPFSVEFRLNAKKVENGMSVYVTERCVAWDAESLFTRE